MNNSFARLIDGMVTTLRQEIIPQVDTEFARGQAFGLIYMLSSIRLRADWSAEFIGEQLAAQQELSVALEPLLYELDPPPMPQAAAPNLATRALEVWRDDNDGRICALIEWLDARRNQIEAKRIQAIEAQLRKFMNRQLKWELETSAKPMFAEISTGSE